MIKAIIFDKDGVLTDSIPLYYKIIQRMMKDIGKKITFDEYYHHCFQDMKSAFVFVKDNMTREQYSGLIKRYYLELFDKHFRYFPGAIESILRLKKDYIIAMATSNHDNVVEHEFIRTGLDKHFTSILTGDIIKKDKPDPAIYIETLKRLKIRADEAIVIEDTISGLNAAKGAKIPCIIHMTDYNKHIRFKDAAAKFDDFNTLTRDYFEKVVR